MTMLVERRERTRVIVTRDGPQLVQTQTATAVKAPARGLTGPPGERGPAGADGPEIECAVAVEGGQVVRPDATGRLVLAQADDFLHAQRVGVADAAAQPGHTAKLAMGFLSLDDWSAATGAPSLACGASYFLSADTPGALTTIPPAQAGQCVVFVGTAISARMISLSIGQPIKL